MLWIRIRARLFSRAERSEVSTGFSRCGSGVTKITPGAKTRDQNHCLGGTPEGDALIRVKCLDSNCCLPTFVF